MLLIVIVASIACIMLVLFILAQNPKGGGLSSSFGGATQIIGARQTADFLEKASWYLAGGILVLVLISNVFHPSGNAIQDRESKMRDQIDQLAAPIPQNPTQTEAQQQAQQQGQKQAQSGQNTGTKKRPGQQLPGQQKPGQQNNQGKQQNPPAKQP